MPVALEYKRGDANFLQRFFINQNGVPFDLTKVTGNLSIIWWWLENSPGAVKQQIPYVLFDGANNNRVSFIVPSNFLTKATDYNCDIEVYSNQGLVFHTDPSFIVSVKQVAGLHTDP